MTLVMLKDHYLKYLGRFAVKYRLLSQSEECPKRKALLLSNSQLLIERHDKMQFGDTKADKFFRR